MSYQKAEFSEVTFSTKAENTSGKEDGSCGCSKGCCYGTESQSNW